MDMRRLEVFCRVVELKSFTKAAEALELSQPTVSEHIRTLEEALSEKLIDRMGREALPTPAGKILYTYARDIVKTRDQAVQALKEFKGALAGPLRLGASTIPGTYVLPQYVGSFKAEHPDIRITLNIGDTAEIVDQVLSGRSEAGLIGFEWSDRRLTLEELFSDELIVGVPADHPWASRKTVNLEDLEERPFIMREPGSGTRSFMTRALEARGFDTSRLSVVAEMGSTEAVRQGIKAGIGVSILSIYALLDDMRCGALSSVRIKGTALKRPLFLVQRRGRRQSPVAAAFLDHLRRESQTVGTDEAQ